MERGDWLATVYGAPEWDMIYQLNNNDIHTGGGKKETALRKLLGEIQVCLIVCLFVF